MAGGGCEDVSGVGTGGRDRGGEWREVQKFGVWGAGDVHVSCWEMREGVVLTVISRHDAQGAYYIDDPTLKWGLGAPIGTCPGYKTGTEVKFVMCASAAPIQKEES